MTGEISAKMSGGLEEPQIPSLEHEIAQLGIKISELSRFGTISVESAGLVAQLETAREELLVADEELRAQYEQLLQVEQLHLSDRWLHERLVALLPVAVLITDGNGMVRSANPAAAGLLRTPVDQLTQVPLFGFVEASDRADLRRNLSKAVATGGDFRTTVTLQPKNTSPIPVEVAVTPDQTSDGAPTSHQTRHQTGHQAGHQAGHQTAEHRVTWVLLRAETEQQTHGSSLMLAQCLAEITTASLAADSMATALGSIARTCRQAFEVPTWVSITIGPPAQPELVASDSRTAQYLDGAQIQTGQGPCQEAWQRRELVVCQDLRQDGRWPRFAAAVAQSPLRSALGVPVHTRDERGAALNIYSPEPALAAPPHPDDAQLLATTVAAVIEEITDKRQARQLAAELDEAMRSRAVIEQAKGLIVSQRGCSPEEAFALLADLSNRTNTKVRQLAANLLDQAQHEHHSEPNNGQQHGPPR